MDNDGVDMARTKRPQSEMAGAREAQAIAAHLGRETKGTRQRQRLTQAQLGRRAGLGQSEVSHLEAGHGAGTSIATWAAIGIALGRPISMGFSRDITPEPRDAGHLVAQELVLRLAARHGRDGSFELPTRPFDPSRSIDVCLIDREHRVMIVVEIWNRLDDLGSGARATSRKVAEAAELAAGVQGGATVASCWLLVDTAANRALVRRFPAVLRARFPGSSLGWVRALADGTTPPREPGIAWVDPRAGRISELRLGRI
jgi:transcriptional regulator with XRE-family HTH domain